MIVNLDPFAKHASAIKKDADDMSPGSVILKLFILILSGYVGLSSIIAGISVPITHNLLAIDNISDPYLQLFGIFIGIFFIFTHRENIKRMLKKEENQFKKIMLFKSSKQ